MYPRIWAQGWQIPASQADDVRSLKRPPAEAALQQSWEDGAPPGAGPQRPRCRSTETKLWLHLAAGNGGSVLLPEGN